MTTLNSTATNDLSALTSHTWKPQPEPARLVHRLLNECLERLPFAARLSQRMLDETGTRMLDWIDHIGLAKNDSAITELSQVGFVEAEPIQGTAVWKHSGGLFPRVRLLAGSSRRLAIKVDSVVDFLFAHGFSETPIKGAPFSSLRTGCIEQVSDCDFLVVERHGTLNFEASTSVAGSSNVSVNSPSKLPADLARHEEALLLRRRDFESDTDGFALANRLIDAAIEDLGRDRACDLFFKCERENWQRRNRAGQIQYARQQALGLGWANHDHHTYRSSRETFVALIAFLEKLGFECRERFYAGLEAGWGAQVIEHPVTGVTIFADVDMSPEEIVQDFSHQPMPPRSALGTVGLWCALHGEAFLQAGLHHLECQFDFASTRDQLKSTGIDTMPPFTDFPYLRQAFTKGEQWKINPVRIERLRSAKRITDAQAETFLRQGAIGSHLEILQRDDGYKGFNQRGINEIIAATDPRRAIN